MPDGVASHDDDGARSLENDMNARPDMNEAPPVTAVPALRLLLVGAGHRLCAAALVAALLWAGFFWAISTPGAP